MAEKIFELQLDLNDAIKQAADLKGTIKDLTDAQKQLKKENKEGTEEFVSIDVALKTAKKGYNELTKEIQRLSMEEALSKKAVKEADAILKTNVKTIAQAEEQTRRLNKIKKHLNVKDEKQKALLDKLNAKVEANTNFIRANSDAEHRRVLNIGNYQSALQGLNIPMVQSVLLLNQKRKALIGVTGAEVGASKGAKLLALAMRSIPLIAIISVITMLVKAFASTQKGIDAIRRATLPLKAVMNTLWGVLQKVGTGLVNVFTSPKKALTDLYNFIKTNLINRFKAFGVILEGIVNLDFKKMTDGILQAGTGVENLTDKVYNLAKETNRMLDEAYQRGKKIASLSEQIESLEQVKASTIARNNRLIKEQELIAKDRTKTEQERADAMELAERLSQANLDLETMILQKKIEAMKLKHKDNDTSKAELKELDELQAEIENKKLAKLGIEMRFLGQKNQLYKQAQKEQEQRLKEYHAKVLQNLKDEVIAYRLKNAEILDADTELNDKTLTLKLQTIAQLGQLQKQALDEEYRQKFGKGYENELAYQNALLSLTQETQSQISEVKKQFYDKELADQVARDEAERQRRLDELDLQIQEIEYSEMAKADKKAEILQLQKEKEIEILNAQWEKEEIDSETHARKLQIIANKYKKKEVETDIKLEEEKKRAKERLTQAQIGMIHSLANLGQSIFGKNKAVASAMALMDTFVAANKILAADPPMPLPLKIAEMVTVISTGLANVANINKVQVGSSGGGGGASVPTRTAPVGASALPTYNQPTQAGGLQTAQPSNVISNQAQHQQTVRVVNVAQDTYDVASNDIYVNNLANS